LVPHVYPPAPFQFEKMVQTYEATSDRILKAKTLEHIEQGWLPDWRTVAGLVLGATGAYTLWKMKKKRR